MKKIIPVVIILLLVGAFYGGMKYTQGKSPASSLQAGLGQRNPEMFGQSGGTRLRQGFGVQGEGFANGEIIAKDEQSITVKLPDGGSKIIFFSETTDVRKMVDGLTTDLTKGEQVIVAGKQNSDGSITAQSIQLKPEIIPSQ